MNTVARTSNPKSETNRNKEMKKSLIKHAGSWAVALGIWLLFLAEVGAAQYVELTAEIDSISWPLRDEAGDLMENPRRTTWKARCVVGTNTWLIENPANG